MEAYLIDVNTKEHLYSVDFLIFPLYINVSIYRLN